MYHRNIDLTPELCLGLETTSVLSIFIIILMYDRRDFKNLPFKSGCGYMDVVGTFNSDKL